jgi:ligand-binding sensor domain-containing protein
MPPQPQFSISTSWKNHSTLTTARKLPVTRTLQFSRRKEDDNHILAKRDGLKVAVIVNDMSEVNVDAQLMKNGSASLSRVDERLVEMQNG